MKIIVFSNKPYEIEFLELVNKDFQRIFTFPNVLITGHQAFLTIEAMTNIATTTLQNIRCFEHGENCAIQITADDAKP